MVKCNGMMSMCVFVMFMFESALRLRTGLFKEVPPSISKQLSHTLMIRIWSFLRNPFAKAFVPMNQRLH